MVGSGGDFREGLRRNEGGGGFVLGVWGGVFFRIFGAVGRGRGGGGGRELERNGDVICNRYNRFFLSFFFFPFFLPPPLT